MYLVTHSLSIVPELNRSVSYTIQFTEMMQSIGLELINLNCKPFLIPLHINFTYFDKCLFIKDLVTKIQTCL